MNSFQDVIRSLSIEKPIANFRWGFLVLLRMIQKSLQSVRMNLYDIDDNSPVSFFLWSTGDVTPPGVDETKLKREGKGRTIPAASVSVFLN